MSNSNFCRNCGARLARKGWRLWMRGAFCDECARRPGVNPRSRTIIVIGLLAAAAFAFGRYLRPSAPPLIIQRAANSPLSDTPLDLNSLAKRGPGPSGSNDPPTSAFEATYICGARTKKGAPCRRRVHVAGERCYQHKGRTAMVALEKLVINPDDRKK
ncbi:MAG: hypothetical protein ACT4OT_01960 [Acidobacteriota bacterium]